MHESSGVGLELELSVEIHGIYYRERERWMRIHINDICRCVHTHIYFLVLSSYGA